LDQCQSSLEMFLFLPQLEVSPFSYSFCSWSLVLPGAPALRSPKGGAFRAKRRARPTTAASPPLPRRTLASPTLGGPPVATGDPPAAPTPASRPADSPPWPARSQALLPQPLAGGAPGSPATLPCGPHTRSSPAHLSPELLRLNSVRPPPSAAVLQPRGPFLPIMLPQPLRLSLAQPQQGHRFHHLQGPTPPL
jgi:hypothetical protein